MCGICGVFTLGNPTESPTPEARALSMLSTMSHRGPDGARVVTRPEGAIGANRLAIRSVRDHQPPLIEDPSGVIVACNGEIDNYKALRSRLRESGHTFELTTDVAVIAPLYLEEGPDFVRHLEGAFAIAIWDPRQQSLLLVRDRGGERHLYYTHGDSGVTFATELAALQSGLTKPANLERDSLAGYLAHGFYTAPATPFEGQDKLGAGEMLVISSEGVRRTRYVDCPIGKTKATRPDMQVFDETFRAAVYAQSELDVDFGVLLSGGVDSSLITAVLRKVRPDKHPTAYSIRFAESSFDEGQHAERVARRLDCPFVPVTVTAEDVPATLKDLIRTTGEPLADPAWVPQALVARRASQDVRLVLAGEGADELFGGYPTYLGAQLAGRYARLPAALRSGIKRIVDGLPVSDKKMTISFLLKRFVQGQDLPAYARHLLWTANMSPGMLRRLGVDSAVQSPSETCGSALDTVQRHDFRFTLSDALLAKADRGGMRHALEVRTPFLHPRVIQFAATLPRRERVNGLTTKVFLKRYALQYLPREVVHRRKRGLSVPLAAWLRGPLHAWARSLLSSPHFAKIGIDNEVAMEMLSEHCAREQDHARALWTLIVLSEWLDWQSEV